MQLVERAPHLDQLQSLLRDAAGGSGCVVTLAGEAGAGKSTLAAAFARQAPVGVRVLSGAAENFGTAEPLGPLHDLARQAGWALPEMLFVSGSRIALFSEVFSLIEERPDDGSATLVILEDVHWADDATLNLIRYIGRRIRSAHILLLVTARSEDAAGQSRLRRALNDIPPSSRVFIDVPALSEMAVAELARQRGLDGKAVFRVTGGNAYFVAEVIEAGHEMPATIRDAVLARADGLSAEDRQVLAAASILPDGFDPALIEALCGRDAQAALEACVGCGLIVRAGEGFMFRHEIARQALEQSLSPVDRRRLNSFVLAYFYNIPNISVARLVHHAKEAQDLPAICDLAPKAAAEAARLGAHRQAVRHYELALAHASAFPEAERASLYGLYAFECHLIGQVERAIAAQQNALALHRQLGDRLAEGDSLRWLSRLSYLAGNREEADRSAAQAVALLETLPASAELAMAYSNLAQLCMLASDVDAAAHWGGRAIALADREALDRPDILSHALNNVGTAILWRDPDGARQMLDRSLDIALANDFQEHAARTFTNRGFVEIRQHAAAAAEEVLARGVAYCIDRDLDTWRDYMRGEQAELMIFLGRWDEAETLAQSVVDNLNTPPLSRYPAVLASAVLKTRRGEPASLPLDELERFLQTGLELQRLAPYAALVAERAWLGLEDRKRALLLLSQASALSREDLDIAIVAFWEHILGGDGQREHEFRGDGAISQMLAGEWKAAAGIWEERRSPYWRAMALLSGDDAAVYEALDIFEALGAGAIAEHVRLTIRAKGGRVAARGPRESTRQNAAGLTRREMDVLRLIDLGKPNAEIGNLLFISAKTVDHHISAILAKLDARSRSEAASFARKLGLLE